MFNKLFVSELILTRKAIPALKITDRYSIHRVIYSLFSPISNDSKIDNLHNFNRILFHSELNNNLKCFRIIILSNNAPTLTLNDTYATLTTKEVYNSYLNYDYYRFKICINPTKRNKLTKKLTPVKEKNAIAQWFSDKSIKSWGFQTNLELLEVDSISVLQFPSKTRETVTLEQADIRGSLKVIDRNLFIKSFSNGIGRARAFGCGLLQLTPLN